MIEEEADFVQASPNALMSIDLRGAAPEPATPTGEEDAAPAVDAETEAEAPVDVAKEEDFDWEQTPEQWRLSKETSAEEIRKKYTDLFKRFTSGEFSQEWTEKYLSPRVENVEEFIAHWEAFKRNDKEYLRTKFPDKLAEIGIHPVMSEEEINSKVEEDMKEKFGEDWEQLYNPNEVLRANSMSRKLLGYQNELLAKYEKENQERAEKSANHLKNIAPKEEPQPVDKEELRQIYMKSYEKLKKEFGDVPEDDYINFVKAFESGEYAPEPKDIYIAMNWKKIVEDAYERGKTDGGKTVGKTIRAAKVVAQPFEPSRVRADAFEEEFSDVFGRVKPPKPFI